jgi:hypothetical protein
MRAVALFALAVAAGLGIPAVLSHARAPDSPATRAARDHHHASAPDAGASGAAGMVLDAGAPDGGGATAAAIPCAEDADCRGAGRHGHCFTAGLAAQYTQAFHDCEAGARWRAAHAPGTCVFDECTDETARGGDGCPPGRRCGTLDMVPFPQRVCLDAACDSDVACRREGGGRCASYLAAGRCRPGGWACSYPHDPCAPRDAERMCPVHPGLLPFCAPRDGRFRCVDEPAVPR